MPSDMHNAPQAHRLESDAAAPAPPAAGEGARLQSDAAKSPKPKRVKRPRPTFDDGALTRVFKFPSKTYPKSSYYMTSDEIIVRIRKGRKKWKWTIPKKKVVSYRTNRWFAKPRWVELELTFTQASRLGLVPPRPKMSAPEVVSDISTDAMASAAPLVPPPDSDAPEPGDASIAADFAPEADLLAAEDEIAVSLADDGDASDEGEYETGLPDDPEEAVAIAVDAPSDARDEPTSVEPPPITSISWIEARPPLASAPAPTTPMPRAPEPVQNRPRRTWMMAAGLALLLTSAAGGLWTLDALRHDQRDEALACAHADVGGNCASPNVTSQIATSPIVTGSIDTRVVAPPENVPVVPLAVAAPPPAELAATVAIEDNLPPIALAQTPPPVAIPTTLTTSRTDTAADAACSALDQVTQAIRVRFYYASPRLESDQLPALVPVLDLLARCPLAKLVIAGHTDSDGHEDRNIILSWRRAEVVRDYLVDHGADAHRISTVGFGQDRPEAANVSPDNKRLNRRAVLHVERERS